METVPKKQGGSTMVENKLMRCFSTLISWLCITLISFYFALALLGCAEEMEGLEEIEINEAYIECPARLITDADVLWICGYTLENGPLAEVIQFEITAALECTLINCYTVKCSVAIYSNLVVEDNSFLGLLQRDNRQIEFICV